MDGNKRWSIENSKTLKDSYISGLNNLLDVCYVCMEKKIKYVSAYALSAENTKRPDIKIIFDIIKDKSSQLGKKLLKDKKIKVKFIGRLDLLPLTTYKIIKQIEKKTSNNSFLHLNIIINYSSEDELLKLINELKNIKKIDYPLIRKNMYLGDVPDPDLLIRTGGYQRLSNFLLLYLQYTEFAFTKTLWPDLKEKELKKIFEKFELVKRNYGL